MIDDNKALIANLVKALRPIAKLEFPRGASNEAWVATTLHCGDQVTAHTVRQARKALSAVDPSIADTDMWLPRE